MWYLILISGLYLVFLASCIAAVGIFNKFLFKFIPFVLGVGLILISSVNLGWLGMVIQ